MIIVDMRLEHRPVIGMDDGVYESGIFVKILLGVPSDALA
jgi:hypothetical protein